MEIATEKPQSIKSYGVQSQRIHLQNNLHSQGLGISSKEEVMWLYKPEDWEVCWEIVFPCYVRSYIHKLSPTWLSKYELEKDDNRHVDM